MISDELEKLVMMANQIATAFESQRGDAARDTAAHLRAFWPRIMREEILRHLAQGGEGLTATAKAAVAQLDGAPQADGLAS